MEGGTSEYTLVIPQGQLSMTLVFNHLYKSHRWNLFLRNYW